MKRFAVFAMDSYYPSGGWHDCIGTADTKEDALGLLACHKHDFWHIVDLTTGEIVRMGVVERA